MEMCENIIKTECKNLLDSYQSFPHCQLGRESIIKNNKIDDFIKTPTKINPEKSEEGKDFAKRLEKKQPDFLVVIAYGKIIPESILDIAKIAPINVH
jgi:methionyl-tRNA formyltransferase